MPEIRAVMFDFDHTLGIDNKLEEVVLRELAMSYCSTQPDDEAVRAVLTRIGLPNPAVIFIFTLGVTVCLAYLSHRYYESRFLALKDRFSRLRPAPAPKAPVEISAHDIAPAMQPRQRSGRA